MCYFNYYGGYGTGIIKFVTDSGSSASCGYSSSTGIFTTQIPGLYYYCPSTQSQPKSPCRSAYGTDELLQFLQYSRYISRLFSPMKNQLLKI